MDNEDESLEVKGDDMKLDNWIDLYCSRLAESTRYTYGYLFRSFVDFCGVDMFGRQKAMYATKGSALKYMLHLEKRGGETSRCGRYEQFCPQTYNHHVTALRKFFSFLQGEGVFKSPLNPFDIPRKAFTDPFKRPTQAIPETHRKALLDAPEATTKQGVCDRAWIAVGMGGGLRRGEILNIKIEDVDLSDRSVCLRTTKSGDHNVRQPISESLFARVESHYQQRIKEGAAPRDALFVCYGCRGNVLHPYQKAGLHGAFKHYVKAIGLDPTSYSLHSMRATAITRGLELGIPHRQLQDFSRHKSIRMVERYDKRESKARETAEKIEF